MADAKAEIARGEYVIGIAIILAALLISATLYVSLGNIVETIAAKSFAVNVQGTTGTGAQGGGSPTAPTQPTKPTAPVADIDVAGRLFRGGANAEVLIVEYSDFQCPFCERVTPTVQQILSTYGDQVKLVYKHFPLESLHPNAVKAAEASECAADQGKFWEMHDAMFADQNKLSTTDLKATAAGLGMDSTAFNACLDGGSKLAIVSADATEGSNYGVSGTPTFFINGQMVVGAQPFSSFKSVIDAELAN
ncbi:DsbA family protein [Candidatus Micrarchaeota archaeon]|nr:DsbA family protein [Candidatus Micrarchaeota archaeon]